MMEHALGVPFCTCTSMDDGQLEAVQCLVSSQSICDLLNPILHPGFGAKISAYCQATFPVRLACDEANHLSSPIGFDLV